MSKTKQQKKLENNLEIKEVKTKKEIKDFINFPLDLYYKNKNYVPCLELSEKQLFKEHNCYSSSCDTVYYNAYLDGQMVGRISGIIQKDANKKWNQKQVRFTRFDSIKDERVSSALFDKVSSWGKEKGMTKMVGPLGFNDLEREGLLIEGFDYLSTFEEQYNYPYYQELIEHEGFKKDVDWVEAELRYPSDEQVHEKIKKLEERVFARYHLKFLNIKSIREFCEKHVDEFFELLDESYGDLYGTCPINEEVKKDIISSFKLIVKPKNIMIVMNEQDEMVAFAICFPSISKAVQKCEGKLTPLSILKILKAINNYKVLDLGLVGVKKSYLKTGIPVAMMGALMDELRYENIDHLETNLNLETNTDIINLLGKFDRTFHKRRRCYIKTIE